MQNRVVATRAVYIPMSKVFMLGTVCLCLLQAACATGRAPGPAPIEDRPRPDAGTAAPAGAGAVPPAPASDRETAPPETGAERPRDAGTAPAVIALLAESDRRLDSGQPESAAASIERALRIAPTDPVLWHRLARIRLRQGQWDQAEALARKSLSLSAGAAELSSLNWMVIASARSALGDEAGARLARQKARTPGEGR